MPDETKPADAIDETTTSNTEAQAPAIADATGDAGTDPLAEGSTAQASDSATGIEQDTTDSSVSDAAATTEAPAEPSAEAQGPADASNPMAQAADPFAVATPSEPSDASPTASADSAASSTDTGDVASPSAPSPTTADATTDGSADPSVDAPAADEPSTEAPATDEPPAIEPPLVDNSAEAIEPPKAPEAAIPSEPGDSAPAAGGQDNTQGGSSESTPVEADKGTTDAPAQPLPPSAVETIDEHPAPSENPAVHPQTGKPLDGDSLLGGGDAEAAKGQGGAQGGGEAAAPAPAEAAPTAANVPDAYTKLTADGAKLADALDELAKDAGAVLVLDLKAAANYAAHIVDTLQLVLDQGGRKKNKRQLENLLSVFQEVEATVAPLLEKDGSSSVDSLEDAAASQLSGIEELVLGMFKKLKAD